MKAIFYNLNMKVAKNSLIYLLSNILSAAMPFILLPILTRVFTPADFGQIAMFQMVITGLSAFVGVNAIGAANRKYYDNSVNNNILSIYNGACLQVLILSCFIILILFSIFSDRISILLDISPKWVFSALLLSVCIFIINLRLGQWQIRADALKFGMMQTGYGLFNLGLSLVFILLLNYGAQGRVDAQVIAALISAVIAIYLLYKDKLVVLMDLNPKYIKDILFFGVPLIPHAFGGFLLSAADRFVINRELGLSQAGIYMAAVQFSMVLSIFFDALNKAYMPWLFGILRSGEIYKKRSVVRYTYFYFIFLIMILLPICLFISPWAFCLLIGKEYQPAMQVIGLLCLGQIFNGMYLMVTNYIFFAKKTQLLGLVTITSGIINVILLNVFVDLYGIIGAAWAFIISSFIQFMFTWILSAKVYCMPWLYMKSINS